MYMLASFCGYLQCQNNILLLQHVLCFMLKALITLVFFDASNFDFKFVVEIKSKKNACG